jgi:NTP pyrophosphatase (non-canonical NTP hydrolase)
MFDRNIGCHFIFLNIDEIAKSVTKGCNIGGNIKTDDMKSAIAFVLAHEIQHANQMHVHNEEEIFYKLRSYKKRGCEREARSFVDDNELMILDIIGRKKIQRQCVESDQSKTTDEIYEIAELFGDLDEVKLSDLAEELRQSGLNSPLNMMDLREIVESSGTKIT